MKIVSKEELRKILLDNAPNFYSKTVEGYKSGYKQATGEDLDPELEADIKWPEVVYNTVSKDGDGNITGIVGVFCQLIRGGGDAEIMIVDLAVETSVPDFYSIHHNVPIVALEPQEGQPGDGRIHFANPEFVEQVVEIGSSTKKRDHLTLVKDGVPVKQYRWMFTADGSIASALTGQKPEGWVNDVALAFDFSFEQNEPIRRAHSRIRVSAAARLTGIVQDELDRLNQMVAGVRWYPQINNVQITLMESTDGVIWTPVDPQPRIQE